MQTTSKAVAYVRTHSTNQDAYDLQVESIKGYCRENDIDLIEIFYDASDKIKFLRGGLNKILNKAVKSKFDYLIVYDYFRLSNKKDNIVKTMIRFHKHNITIISLCQKSLTYDGSNEKEVHYRLRADENRLEADKLRRGLDREMVRIVRNYSNISNEEAMSDWKKYKVDLT